MNGSYLMPLILMLSGCAADISIPHQQAKQWASEEAGQASERAGIANRQTYPKIVSKALCGDQDALSKVFRVSPSTDAAAAELQAGILAVIIRTTGDDVFAEALKKERPNVVSSNIDLVTRELGDDANLFPHSISLR